MNVLDWFKTLSDNFVLTNASASEELRGTDYASAKLRPLFDKIRLVDTEDSNISVDMENEVILISMNNGKLTSPLGGVSFFAPVSPTSESKAGCTVLTLGIQYDFRFPEGFHWNQGGYLPGLYGVYVNESSTAATAAPAFECRGRWNAHGNLLLKVQKVSEDNPNEWSVAQEDRVSLSCSTWHTMCIVVHIDGQVSAACDGVVFFSAHCHSGFQSLDGVRMCAYATNNSAIEERFIEFKNMSVAGQLHDGGGDCESVA
jgi:hypothetical protein